MNEERKANELNNIVLKAMKKGVRQSGFCGTCAHAYYEEYERYCRLDECEYQQDEYDFYDRTSEAAKEEVAEILEELVKDHIKNNMHPDLIKYLPRYIEIKIRD